MAIDLFEDSVEAAYLDRSGSAAPAGLPDNFRLPANPISTAFAAEGAVGATLVIEGGERGGMAKAIYQGVELDLRALLEKGMAWALNGNAGLPAAPWQTFKLGSSILLEVQNRTKFEQPLHVEGHVWQLLDDPARDVWRDTVVVPAAKTARVAFVADNPGAWRLYSTIAERLDSGLITSFLVESA